jgi:hypothetical protein
MHGSHDFGPQLVPLPEGAREPEKELRWRADGQRSGRHALRFVSGRDFDKGVLALLPRDAPTARRPMLSDMHERD